MQRDAPIDGHHGIPSAIKEPGFDLPMVGVDRAGADSHRALPQYCWRVRWNCCTAEVDRSCDDPCSAASSMLEGARRAPLDTRLLTPGWLLYRPTFTFPTISCLGALRARGSAAGSIVVPAS